MAYKTYKGKFTAFTNPQKYLGNIDNVVYRSMWERHVMKWLDENPNVKEWASEELFFPYDHPVTGKRVKYYPDFYVKMTDGVQRVIEVKPLKEINRPPEPKRKTKGYMNAIATWVVNQEKWKAARFYCAKNDLQFEIWSEQVLNEMGIMKSGVRKTINESTKRKPTRAGKTKRPSRPRPTRKS